MLYISYHSPTLANCATQRGIFEKQEWPPYVDMQLACAGICNVYMDSRTQLQKRVHEMVSEDGDLSAVMGKVVITHGYINLWYKNTVWKCLNNGFAKEGEVDHERAKLADGTFARIGNGGFALER